MKIPFKLVCLVFALACATAGAATVSFTSSLIDPNSTGTFLDNSGTVLSAVNLGTVRTAPYTYNAPTTR